MARAMGSLSSFGQSMRSVAHNLTGDFGNFRCVWTLLYERVDLSLSAFKESASSGPSRLHLSTSQAQGSSIRGLPVIVGGR